MNFLNFLMVKFPGAESLDNFKDAWSNWITGAGKDVNKFFSPNPNAQAFNPVIQFYHDHQQFFHVTTSAIITVEGFVQNLSYTAGYGLASISSMMVQGALYLFTIIPEALKDKSNPLHQLVYGAMMIGVALMALMMTFYVINALRGAKGSHIRSMLINGMTSLFLMIAVPFIATTTGDMMTRFVLPNISTGSTTNLADVPLRDNTLDLATWATDGFQSQPFASKSPNLNGLDKMGINDIPDFTTKMTLPQINQLNKMVSQSPFNDKSKTPNVKDGDQSQSPVDIKNVGNVFQYKLQASPLGDGTYTLENLDIKDGTFSFAKTRYKRYTVQNIPAIAGFLVIIIVGFLLAIKISRTVILSYVELVGAFLQAGRDVGSSQPMKQAVMKQLNVALAATVDILMLYLFTQMIGTVPNDVANYVAGLPGGEFARPMAYVVTMGVLGLTAYNGSSVLEKSFGVEAGYSGSNNMFSMMTAPGAMLGSFVGAKLANQRLQKRLSEIEGGNLDKPGEAPREDAGFVNNGFDSSVFERDDKETQEDTSQLDSSDTEETNVADLTDDENNVGSSTLEENSPDNVDAEQLSTDSDGDAPEDNSFIEEMDGQNITPDSDGEKGSRSLDDESFDLSELPSDHRQNGESPDSYEGFSGNSDNEFGLENEGFNEQIFSDNNHFEEENSYSEKADISGNQEYQSRPVNDYPGMATQRSSDESRNSEPTRPSYQSNSPLIDNGTNSQGESRSYGRQATGVPGNQMPEGVKKTNNMLNENRSANEAQPERRTAVNTPGNSTTPFDSKAHASNRTTPTSQDLHDSYTKYRQQRQVEQLLQQHEARMQQRLGKQQHRAQRMKQYLTQQQKHPLTDVEHHDGKGEVD